LDISGAFIQKNKYQTTKTLSSEKHCFNPLRLAPYTGNNYPITEDESPEVEIKFTTAFRTAVTEIVREFPTGSILLLGRNNSDIKFLSEDNSIQVIEKPGETRVIMKDHPEVEMTFMTVHRSKGLEADNVILLNAKNEKAGFPNQIVDDPILNLLREAHEEYPFAEERRLFYVAITRTRNYVYILTPIVKTSRFIDDLKELKSGINEIRTEVAQEIEKIKYSNTISCPVCKVGTLVKRKGAENKTFVSCSNFPACTYKTSDLQTVRNNTRCPVCDNFLIKRKGAFGEFLGCLSYPHCTYSADLQSEKDIQTRITSYASRFDYSPQKWTLEDDYQLKEKFHNGMTMEMLSVYFGRSRSAIISRLKKLELID
jgi:DNA helicase-4